MDTVLLTTGKIRKFAFIQEQIRNYDSSQDS